MGIGACGQSQSLSPAWVVDWSRIPGWITNASFPRVCPSLFRVRMPDGIVGSGAS